MRNSIAGEGMRESAGSKYGSQVTQILCVHSAPQTMVGEGCRAGARLHAKKERDRYR